MGAWSTDAFGNDDACDWAYRLEESDDLSAIIETLEATIQREGYLEAPLGSEAVAACEVVARLKGNWGTRNSYSETADKWVEGHPTTVPPELVQLAHDALAAVQSLDSELKELWDEANDKEWGKSIEDLRRRLA